MEADTIYLLSDGEPTTGITDTRDILYDLQIWIRKRGKPLTINTIAFLMGHHTNDPKVKFLNADKFLKIH
jgi:hypothetical protein